MASDALKAGQLSVGDGPLAVQQMVSWYAIDAEIDRLGLHLSP